MRWMRALRKKNPLTKSAPKEWQRPETDEEYQQLLHWDGFIAPLYWDEDDLNEYPAIIQDLSDLDEYLLPTFWEYNQKSRYYQVRYHTYQWVFIIGAFVTTVFGTLATYYSGNVVSIDMGGLLSRFNITIPATTLELVTIFSVLTTIVSGVTSYYTLLSNQGEPRKRWASYRRLAEELRILYFKFISRLEPYDRPNRVETMRRRVIEIREEELSSAA